MGDALKLMRGGSVLNCRLEIGPTHIGDRQAFNIYLLPNKLVVSSASPKIFYTINDLASELKRLEVLDLDRQRVMADVGEEKVSYVQYVDVPDVWAVY